MRQAAVSKAPARSLPVSDAITSRALDLVRASASTDAEGYVHLQTIPYRAHHLLARAVLEVTQPGDRVLECGVSSGYFASVLVRAGLKVDGHELDPEAGERAREVCDRVVVGDLNAFDPIELASTYKVLLFGDTLEHLPEPAVVLRVLREVLEPDGALVLSIPNIANWAIRMSLLAGRFDYTDRGIMDRTHLRFYTRRTLTAMLADAGFAVERMIVTVPVPMVKGERLGRLAYRIGNAWPGLVGHGFVVTARPVG